MKRYQDWPGRLKDYIEVAEKRPFSWGRFNCCHFVSGGIEALSGEDVSVLFSAGAIRGVVSARKQLKAFSGGGVLEMAETIAEASGMEPVRPAMAGRGDVVYLKDGTSEALGLVSLNGKQALFLMPPVEGDLSDGGFVRVPVLACQKAWKIP